jgi:hypothetical protein
VCAGPAADGLAAPLDREVAPGDQQAGVHLGRPGGDDLEHVVVLGLADHGGAVLDDAGLLDRHLGRGVAQLGVVEGDPVDHRHLPVDQVGGVPGAAHADLDHLGVHRQLGEPGEGEDGQGLVEGHRLVAGPVDLGQERLQVRPGLGELVGGDGSGGQRDPLTHVLEVGAGVDPGPDPEGGQQGRDHPGGRGLAVGPGQVHRRCGPLGMVEQLGQPVHPVEARPHPGRHPRVQRIDGVLVVHDAVECSGHRHHRHQPPQP